MRAVIVGGGIIGVASAYFAAKAGAKVTLLDQGPKAGPNCSTGNAGMVVPSHFVPLAAPGMIAQGLRWMWRPESPFAIHPKLSWDLMAWAWRFWRASRPERVEAAMPILRDLSLESKRLIVELSEGQEFGLQRKGLLMLCKTEEALSHERDFAAQAKRMGVEAELLDGAAAQIKEPGVRMEVAGGIYFPQDCHLDPAAFRSFLIDQAARLGVEFLWNHAVDEVEFSEKGRVARLLSGRREFEADEFVLAGGIWSTSLAKKLGISIPMQPGKGYSLTLADPPAKLSLCSILTEARVAVTPMGQALRVGGTMEIGGREGLINDHRVQGIIKSVEQYYPELRAECFQNKAIWHGLRPCSPDGLPYLGRSRHCPNVIIAAGHAMLGLSLGPVTGLLVARLLSGTQAGIDLSLLSPDRYS